MFMWLVPQARSDGLSADAGGPSLASAAAAVVLGVVALALTLGLSGAVVGALVVALAGLLLARLSMREIGGQTGDVIGALEQVNEMLILSMGAALLGLGIAP
jgi:adenosylcobinamide-GDP ribazoletransferase